jgi:hypothetical protein
MLKVVVNKLTICHGDSVYITCRVALIRTDGSEERIASIVRISIDELGIMLAVTSN